MRIGVLAETWAVIAQEPSLLTVIVGLMVTSRRQRNPAQEQVLAGVPLKLVVCATTGAGVEAAGAAAVSDSGGLFEQPEMEASSTRLQQVNSDPEGFICLCPFTK